MWLNDGTRAPLNFVRRFIWLGLVTIRVSAIDVSIAWWCLRGVSIYSHAYNTIANCNRIAEDVYHSLNYPIEIFRFATACSRLYIQTLFAHAAIFQPGEFACRQSCMTAHISGENIEQKSLCVAQRIFWEGTGTSGSLLQHYFYDRYVFCWDLI